MHKERKRERRFESMSVSRVGMALRLPWKLTYCRRIQQVEERYGIRFMHFVGDGDSSVNPTLVSSVPMWAVPFRRLNVKIMVLRLVGEACLGSSILQGEGKAH